MARNKSCAYISCEKWNGRACTDCHEPTRSDGLHTHGNLRAKVLCERSLGGSVPRRSQFQTPISLQRPPMPAPWLARALNSTKCRPALSVSNSETAVNRMQYLARSLAVVLDHEAQSLFHCVLRSTPSGAVSNENCSCRPWTQCHRKTTRLQLECGLATGSVTTAELCDKLHTFPVPRPASWERLPTVLSLLHQRC